MQVAGGAVEAGVAEGEDAAVGRHQPVALAVGRGGHPHDGLVEVQVAGGAVEAGVAEGEDAPVGRHQPVALAIGRGGHADDGLVEGVPAHASVERGTEGEDAAVGGGQAVAGRGRARHRAAGLPGLAGVRVDHQRRLVDGLEGARRHLLELVDEGARPGRIGRPAEVPVGAVVRQDQAVLLHGPEDDLRLGRVAGDVVTGLQPEAGAHGREVRIAGGSPLHGGPAR